MDGIDGEAGDIARDDLFPVDFMRPDKDGSGVHDTPINDDCG